MRLEIDKNMCRICMKSNDGISIYSVLDTGIIEKFHFCTQLEISKTDDLPKIICNKCVGQLEIAYEFCKQAECSDKYLRQVITHHKEKLNQSALRKEGLYDEMVLEIYRRVKVEQDNQIEQLTDFESEEVSIVNIPPTLEEGINCKGTERLTDSISMCPVIGECSAADKVKIEEIEEANIEKIQETKQINVFTIAKVTTIPKTEFNQTNETTGNESCSQEDIDSLSNYTQIKVQKGDQINQPTDVKTITISDTTEKGIQYKKITCGANIANIEKLQEKIFTMAKVSPIHKNEDDQTDKFECIECGVHFTRKESLKRHSLIHSGERQPETSRKRRTFKRNKSLKRHSLVHSGERSYKSKGSDQTDKCVCMVCGECFTTNSSLKRHSLTHSGVRKYKCNFCSRSFALSYNLESHKRLHTGERPYTCEACGSHFRSKKTLTQHVFIKHQNQKKAEMEINGVKIQETKPINDITITEVTSKRKNDDDQTSKIECILCGAHFTQKGSLNRHSLIHSGERPHKCNSCDRSFAVKCHLTRHMMLHSDEKPYTCETCGLLFRHQSSLKRHVFTKHENQKKAEVKRIALKQKEQLRRRRQLLLARETPEEAAVRREKEAARTKQRYRAKQRQRSNE